MMFRMQARQLMVGDKVMEGDDPFLVTSVTFDDNGVNVTFDGILEQVHPHDQLLDVERQLVPDGPEMPVDRLPPGTYTAEFAGIDDNGNPVIDYATVRPFEVNPAIEAGRKVQAAATELNRAIAALPVDCYAEINVINRDIKGRVRRSPRVDVSVGKVR